MPGVIDIMDHGNPAVPLIDKVIPRKVSCFRSVDVNTVKILFVKVAQPDYGNILYPFQDLDRMILPGDADNAVEPAVDQIVDPVLRDHPDSCIGA